MSEHAHGAGDEHERAEIRAWRDEAVRLSREHERRCHAGERCGDHSVDMVAFAAHSLGLRSTSPEWIGQLLLALSLYEEAHEG